MAGGFQGVLILGHVGITLGLTYYLERVVLGQRAPACRDSSTEGRSPGWLRGPFRLRRLDYRLVVVGSLLPDLVDKPLGLVLLRETLSTGWSVAHSLAFIILLATLGLWLARRQVWLLTLAWASLLHILEDRIWVSPRVFLWPALGASFPREEPGHWIDETAQLLFIDPFTWGVELLGLAILLSLGVVVLRRRQVHSFLRVGRLD